ncbi:MAG TPA: ATP-binding protein [Aggregatilineales bacterium]|nr:ATP-binding protein [Aggregatilineales bacterium]
MKDQLSPDSLRKEYLRQRLAIHLRLMIVMSAGFIVFGIIDGLNNGGPVVLQGAVANTVFLAIFFFLQKRLPHLAMYGHIFVTSVGVLYATHYAGGYMVASVVLLALIAFIDVITLARVRDGVVCAAILTLLYVGLIVFETTSGNPMPIPELTVMYSTLGNNNINVVAVVLLTLIIISLVTGLFGELFVDNAIRLALAQQEAERANALKSSFLTTVSHDLRTPLNAILNLSQYFVALDFGDMTEEQMRYMRIIMASGEELMQQVTDLLEYARIDTGDVKVDPKPVDIERAAQLAIETAVNLLGNKQINLELNISPELPRAYADPIHVRRILLNLLNNALKFTQIGKVVLSAERRGNIIQVSVSDTGPGISPEDQERIFLPFEQTMDGRQTGGAGLGLAICRSLVFYNGGSLTLKSSGAGSTFTFTLPIADPVDATPSLIPVAEGQPP